MIYHLIAFAVNATSVERAEVEWALASKSPDGNWYDWNGHRYYPFHTQPIECPDLPIPPEWIDHIQDIARRNACEKMRAYSKEPAFDLFDLSVAMRLSKPAKPAAKPFLRRM